MSARSIEQLNHNWTKELCSNNSATFTVLIRYVLSIPSSTLSIEVTVCNLIITDLQCPALEQDPHRTDLNYDIGYDTVVTSVCDVNYGWEDGASIGITVCQSNGMWSNEMQQCQRKLCCSHRMRNDCIHYIYLLMVTIIECHFLQVYLCLKIPDAGP